MWWMVGLVAAAVGIGVLLDGCFLMLFRGRSAELPVLTRPVAVGWTGAFMDGTQPVTVTVTKIYDDFADLRLPDGTLAFAPLIALFNAEPPLPAYPRRRNPPREHPLTGGHDLEGTAVIRAGTGEQVFRCTICESRGTLTEMCPPGDWRVELEGNLAVVRTGNVAVRFPIPAISNPSSWRLDLICLQGRRKHAVPRYIAGVPGRATVVAAPALPAGGTRLGLIHVPPADYHMTPKFLP